MYQIRRRSKTDNFKESRVNWRKTRVPIASCLDDSESGTSTPSTSSESEFESDQSEEEAPLEIAEDHKPNGEGSDAEETCAVSRSRRKRVSTTILTESSSDSDSDVGGRPVRRFLSKKRQNIQLSDSETEVSAKQDAEKKAAEAKEVAAKRRDRQNKLFELSKRRRSRKYSSPTSSSRRKTLEDSSEAEGHSNDDNDDEKEEDASYQFVHSSEEDEDDKDSLKDFIVESDDQEGKDGSSVQGAEGSLLSHHLPQFVTGSMLTHFQVVVKALLINALDKTFLKSLYDGNRTKKYALEMKDSLYHLDQRSVLPRLENLKQRSRWSDRYKERVECYPKVRLTMVGVRGQSCQACELHRNCSYTVRLSGQLYDNRTLQHDEFMPDDTQAFQVGSVCARRTEVYHQLKHLKYHLFCHCQAVLKEEKDMWKEDEEEPVKETVSRVLIKLQQRGWITEEYEKFQDYLNDADYFQEEKLD